MDKEAKTEYGREPYYGNIQRLRPGQLLDYVVKRHEATRRGLHRDIMIGSPRVGGLFSWATNAPGLPQEGERIGAIRTNQHEHKYKNWQGIIPPGRYGAGRVTNQQEGKMLVTNKDDKHVSLSTADKKHPERYSLIGSDKDRGWLLVHAKTPTESGAEKPHYKSVSEEQALKAVEEGGTMSPKIDGALNFLNLNHGKAEMLSHRISKTTGKPVIQTERFFGSRPHLDIPKEFNNSTLLTEVYGKKDGKAIPSQQLSGILNSSIAKALETQNSQGVSMHGMLFDIAKKQGKPVELPYEQRKALLASILKHLPKNKFHLPEGATTPKEAIKMLQDVKSGKHPLTREGVVVHPKEGNPLKHKLMEESDVHIRGMFPAEKGSKYDGKSVGGFTYSHEAKGPVVGRVGSGITDEMRALMFKDPKSFINRIAKIKSHERFINSGAHRVPVFLGLHEDYPGKEKVAEDVTPRAMYA